MIREYWELLLEIENDKSFKDNVEWLKILNENEIDKVI